MIFSKHSAVLSSKYLRNFLTQSDMKKVHLWPRVLSPMRENLNPMHSSTPPSFKNLPFEEEEKELKSPHFFKYFALLCGFGIGITMKELFVEKDSILYGSIHASSPLDVNGDEGEGKSLRRKHQYVADIVENLSPSVVSIISENVESHFLRTGFDLGQSGSGFILSSDGLIITNNHVVAESSYPVTRLVGLSDDSSYKGRVLFRDKRKDLALLKIDAKELDAVKLGDSSDIRAGEFVIALGSPFQLSNSISYGIISNPCRVMEEVGVEEPKTTSFIQVDATINNGNSGGPLVNLDSEVIGINTLRMCDGISFSIPINDAKIFIDEYLKKAKRVGGYPCLQKSYRFIGVNISTLTTTIRREVGVSDDVSEGIVLLSIVVHSPAFSAGLKPGDVITHINGYEILTTNDFFNVLEKSLQLTMVVMRGNERYVVKVDPEMTEDV